MNEKNLAVKTQITSVAQLVHNEEFVKKANDVLGKSTQQFMSSVLSLVNSSKDFAECDPVELYNTCLMSAALKLPFNANLGQAYIVVFKDHGVPRPQLQIGWKGFVQLSQRSGLFKTINCSDVREGEIKKIDRLTGEIEFDWCEDVEERNSRKIIGYVAFFELLNGFRKSLYMTNEELRKHAGKYSQTYKKGCGVWKDNFEAMSQKTVIKLLLNKFAPLAIDSELARAMEIDQTVENGEFVDNKPNFDVKNAAVEGKIVENSARDSKNNTEESENF